MHKLAKDILQIEKRIKVPSVIKTSPDGKGKAYKIRDSKVINAHSVEIEMSFYEDEKGILKWQKLSISEQEPLRNRLIRPDVSFFDINGIPILLIEIIVSNDISEDKYLKIKRFGIDTVKVNIPTHNLELVNTFFDTTIYTKWVFNNDEQRTTYISIPTPSGRPVSSSDELEGGIYADSFTCRSNEIKNFIRAVERSLEQKSYSSIKGELDGKLFELEQHSKRDSKRLRELQKEHEREIENEFESDRERLDFQKAELDKYEKQFRLYKTDLEKRYKTRRDEFETKGDFLRESQEQYQSTDQDEIDRIEKIIKSRGRRANGISFEDEERQIEIEEEQIETATRNVENAIRGIGERRTDLLQNSDRKSNEFSNEIRRIETKFRELGEALDRRFQNRDFVSISPLGQRIAKVIEGGKLLGTIESTTRQFNEFSNARKIIKSETWRDWD